ncbi:MAG TPA: PAS domain-containing sensor histidine kinase [Polyangiales bacterium]|nr:PAS domain-containing sensor histidine kinase [Polyangiales bacterium]
MANLKSGRTESMLLTQLSGLREVALERATNLRKHATPGTKSELLWMSLALQELDVAHEELRVVEEELHERAEELGAAHDVLELERKRYRDLFEFAPEPYLITDATGVVIEANLRACELLNIQASFVLGKPFALFVGEHDRPLMRHMLSLLVSTAEVLTFDLRVCPRRSTELVSIKASVRRSVSTALASVVLHWSLHQQRESDTTTQIEQLRRELVAEKRRCDEAEHARAKRDEMLAFVAHELRNPLNSASGWIEILARQGTGPAAREHGLHVLARNVDVLTRLTEQLVDQTRVNQALITLECEETDMRALLERVCQDAHGVAEAKHQRFACEFAPDLPSVRCDEFRLRQALANVVGNALKFTPSEGAVQLTARVFGDVIEIAVRDSGPGIAQEHLRSIFEPFVRLDAHSTSGGLGLGLNIARTLVELHGGHLTVESDGLGSGTTFRMRLPLDGPRADAQSATPR